MSRKLTDAQREARRAKERADRETPEYKAHARAYNASYRRTERGAAAYKRATMRYRYGITPEQWDAMFEAQGKKCACCGSADPGTSLGWSTDHIRGTKIVRGILCARCNRGLGHFDDKSAGLRRALIYLEKTDTAGTSAGLLF